MGAGARPRLAAGLTLSALVICVVPFGPASAAAQTVESGYPSGQGRVTVGGDLMATVSPPDSDAFFNYTNYDQNSLRGAQLRLVGEWKMLPSLSFLGELRADNGAGVQAAAWYLRWHPKSSQAFDIQAGRIPPVIGLFAREPYGRDNLQIGAPLAYQYLLSLRPDALPSTADDLIRMRGRGWEPSFPIGSAIVAPGIPIVSAFKWDTGAEAHWHVGRVDAAGSVTRGSVSVPAPGLDRNSGSTWSGRFAVDPADGLTLGVSGARGPWVNSSTLALLPSSLGARDTQTVIGADLSFGWGRWLLRGEELRSTFEVPLAGVGVAATNLSATSGYLEARYRLRPRWQIAGSVEYLTFSTIEGALSGGQPISWDAPVERVSTNVGYRVSKQIDLRVGWQMNWRDGGRILARGYPALQLLAWF